MPLAVYFSLKYEKAYVFNYFRFTTHLLRKFLGGVINPTTAFPVLPVPQLEACLSMAWMQSAD